MFDDEDERFLDELPLLDLLLLEDRLTDSLLDRLLDERFTADLDDELFLNRFTLIEEERFVTLRLIPSKAVFPTIRPTDLKNFEDPREFCLVDPIRFRTVAVSVLLSTADRFTDRLTLIALRSITVLPFTLIRSLLDLGATTALLLSLFDRFLLALEPDDRFDELLFTAPLLRLLEELRFTVPLLLLFEDDRLRLTDPLLLLFVLDLFTVPLERFVFVRLRLKVERLFVRLDAFDRIVLADRLRLIVLRLRFT